MKKFFLSCILLFFIGISFSQSPMPSITGWKMLEQNGHYSFMPAGGGGKTFVYEVMALQRGNGEMDGNWFKGVADKDLERAGYTLPANDNTKVNVQSSLYNYTMQVSDRNGRKWLTTYVGYQLSGGEYRLARMISSPDVAYFKANIQPAITHFGKLAKQDGVVIKGRDGSTGERATERKTTASSKRIKPEELMTDNGLKPGEVKGIAIHLEYGVGVGGMMITKYEPYLLLTDGSIYNDPVISPYKFDVAKSKQLEPRKWGTWKAVGKTIVINWPAEEKEKDRSQTWEKNWFWARPATTGEKIAGSYGTISGGGNTAFGGNVMVVSSTQLMLNKDGQFTMASVGGGSNSGDAGVSSTAYAHKDAAGTYVLNGFSVALHFNNGKVEQKAFYFYPDSKDVFGIGARVYTPKGK
jgi:hypothetical protein